MRSSLAGDRAAEILEDLPYRKLLEDLKAKGSSNVERELDAILAQAKTDSAAYASRNPASIESGISTSPSHPLSPDASPESGPSGSLHPVALVGAGPGHPGLLTVLAAETLRRAEVIIHDRLIPEETLHLAPPECRLIPVGKRGHTGQSESARQEDIEAQLVEQARLGKRVVRLKGGDPFVYGRGWEEVLALEAAGIPWSIVPGVSSTTGGPTWAGIPLTHRGVARSYAVMSGMAYSQTNTEVPKADTIVLVMGLHRLAEIVPTFLAQGWSAGHAGSRNPERDLARPARVRFHFGKHPRRDGAIGFRLPHPDRDRGRGRVGERLQNRRRQKRKRRNRLMSVKLKLKHARLHENDREAYTDAKAPFVAKVLTARKSGTGMPQRSKKKANA